MHTHNDQRQTLTNLQAVLEAAGSDLAHVLKVNVFITTMDDFAPMNEAYDEFFTQDPKPVRFFGIIPPPTLPLRRERDLR